MTPMRGLLPVVLSSLASVGLIAFSFLFVDAMAAGAFAAPHVAKAILGALFAAAVLALLVGPWIATARGSRRWAIAIMLGFSAALTVYSVVVATVWHGSS